MTVYADILFLINFVFNAEILVVLCKIYSQKIPFLRVFLSSFFGGIISVFSFIPYLEFFARVPAGFVVSFIMVYLVFYPIDRKEMFFKYFLFLSISFMLSGAIFFLGFNAFLALVLPVGMYFSLCMIRKNIKKKKGLVVLEYNDKKIEVSGFFDSGNMLLSGGMPVILGNKRVFKELFGCDFSNENILYLSKSFNMRVVPYVALGKAGTVMGIKLSRIWVDGKEYNDVVLAYAGDKFSDELVLNSIMI